LGFGFEVYLEFGFWDFGGTLLFRDRRAFPEADLEFVPIRIFEKNGVISRAVINAQLRAFDILSASLADDIRGFIHRFAARRPKRDPISVRLVIRLFGEPKKIDRDVSFRLEQTPALAAFIDAKTNGRQNLRIKALGGFAIFYPQIDMIE
jgi:hypothetical protein